MGLKGHAHQGPPMTDMLTPPGMNKQCYNNTA